jgi:hypothetical protein
MEIGTEQLLGRPEAVLIPDALGSSTRNKAAASRPLALGAIDPDGTGV